jgi:hypothetical protein
MHSLGQKCDLQQGRFEKSHRIQAGPLTDSGVKKGQDCCCPGHFLRSTLGRLVPALTVGVFVYLSTASSSQSLESSVASTASQDPAVIDEAWQQGGGKYDAARAGILARVIRLRALLEPVSPDRGAACAWW